MTDERFSGFHMFPEKKTESVAKMVLKSSMKNINFQSIVIDTVECDGS